jgi:hypothetical protein
MDPYLEGPAWESFHAALIDDIGRQLAAKLRPKYLVRVERRFVADADATQDDLAIAPSSTYPDVAVLHRAPKIQPQSGPAVGVIEPPMQLATVITRRAPQRSLSIVDVAERVLVSAIELLSPGNKRVGGGYEEYIERRDNFLASSVHLIEIDLLRRGTRVPMHDPLPAVPYFAFVSRAGNRPMTGTWPITLQEPLPEIPIPLLPGDQDATLALQVAFTETYDAFGFDLELNYSEPPPIPLANQDQAWVRPLLSALVKRDTQS